MRKTALQLARSVLKLKTPDLLTVELAALLHDVLDKKYVSAAQASDPYNYFLPFFTELHSRAPSIDLVADGRAKNIAMIVENVSWSTEKKLRAAGKWGEWHEGSIELHCVQDADRLDAIGFLTESTCLKASRKARLLEVTRSSASRLRFFLAAAARPDGSV